MYELEYFYEEQLARLRKANIEAFNFEDMLCQLLDMIHPRHSDFITVNDIKKSGLAPQFYDALFNTMRFLEHEAKEPSQIRAERLLPPMSPWDRFVQNEYAALLAADSAGNSGNLLDDSTDEEEDGIFGRSF